MFLIINFNILVISEHVTIKMMHYSVTRSFFPLMPDVNNVLITVLFVIIYLKDENTLFGFHFL